MKPLLTAVAAATLLSGSLHAGWFDDCKHTATRSATVSFAGAKSVRILARAGSLDVKGVRGATNVEARGTACASSESLLSKVGIKAQKNGTEVLVQAVMPDVIIGAGSFRLDLDITVPAGIPVQISDTSGSMTVSGIGPTKIEDSSGEIEVRQLLGPLTIEDSSGEIDVMHVAGGVTIEDSSGEINVKHVNGNVVIEEDSSGGIDVSDVKGSVLVKRDGSGSISVADIRGNFIVESDGSGGIESVRVAGTVRVPSQ